MGYPPLPPAPNFVPAPQGPQGGIQGGAPGAIAGTGPSVGGSIFSGITQGLQSFVQNYVAQSKAARQEAMQRVESAINAMMMGIPVDQKQIARDIKKSKLPISLEEPEGSTVMARQQAASDYTQKLQASMIAGQLGGPTTNIQAGTPSIGGAPGLAPSMRVGGPIMPGAPSAAPGAPPSPIPVQGMGPEWMQQLTALGRAGLMNKETMAKLQQGMYSTATSALAGDPVALEMATRTGLLKSLGARDEFFLLAHKLFPELSPEQAQGQVGKMMMYDMMGGPQMKAKLLDLAKDMMPHFGGDLSRAITYVGQIFNGEQPKEIPQMSFADFYKLNEMTAKTIDQFPTAAGPARIAASYMSAGRMNEGMNLLTQIAQRYPTKEQIQQENWTKTFMQTKEHQKDTLALERERYNQGVKQFNMMYSLDTLKNFQSMAQSEFDNWWKVYTNKDSSNEQKNSAMEGLASALQKKGMKVTTDSVFKLLHPIEGQTMLKPKAEGVQKFVGKPKNPFTGQEDDAYANGLWNYIKRLGLATGEDLFFGREQKEN